jgi:hypothetical protein
MINRTIPLIPPEILKQKRAEARRQLRQENGENSSITVKRITPTIQNDFVLPGRGQKPRFCRTKVGTGVYVKDDDIGKIKSNWVDCKMAQCPSCSLIWQHTRVFDTLARIEKQRELDGNLKAWFAVYSIREDVLKQEGVVFNEKMRSDALRYIDTDLRRKGIDKYYLVFHTFKIAKFVKERMDAWYFKKYGKQTPGSLRYELLGDLDFLATLGLYYNDYRQATDTYYHWHVIILDENCPDVELRDHENGRESRAKRLLKSNLYSLNTNTADTQLQRDPNVIGTTLSDGNLIYPTELTDTALVHHLEYLYNHAAVSNKKGFRIKSGIPKGELSTTPISVDSLIGDPAAVYAFDLMRQAGLKVKWVGKHIYPSWDAPDFNEDAPAKANAERPYIHMKELFLPSGVFATGETILLSDPRVHERRRFILEIVTAMTEAGTLYSDAEFSMIDIIKNLFNELDEISINKDLLTEERVVYINKIKGIEWAISHNLIKDCGRCGKKEFYGHGITTDETKNGVIDNMVKIAGKRFIVDGLGYDGFLCLDKGFMT